MNNDELAPDWPALITRIRVRTPARVLVDRAGAGYRTGTQLELRQAHAAARDAVRNELELQRDLGREFVEQWKLFEVSTLARTKDEYLLRPDLGRKFNDDAKRKIIARCPEERDLQIVIGDGLSVTAVATQVPQLLPLLMEQSEARRWKTGQPFAIRHCRVGIMNEIGELLRPKVVVLLIGERPGLATAESLSAYMALRPKAGDHDANRNLISNIHARGVSIEQASTRIINLAALMMQRQLSGVGLKEEIGSSGRRVTGSSEQQNLLAANDRE
jgi:ethanolamine ammonia-lyase small subunit